MPTQGADVLNAVAFNHMKAGQYEKAYYWLKRALEMEPKNPHVLNNLASSLKALQREPEAVDIYRRLIAEQPNYMPPYNNLAYSLLRNGDYAEGWLMYFNRHRAHAKHAVDHEARINPLTGLPFYIEGLAELAELRGKDVILVPEQGLGDELFFLRFTQRFLEVSGAASLWYAPMVKLFPLARKWKFPVTITDTSFDDVPKGNAAAVPLGDLPFLCGHDGSWFPGHGEVEADEVEVEPAIGVTWRAGVAEGVHQGTISKFVPPRALGEALRGEQRRIIVIQRGMRDAEFQAFKDGLGRDDVEVFEPKASPGQELLTILRRLRGLQEYVGVSNTNMHMLGLVGRGAHVLVPTPPDWRWPSLGGANDSPWFPHCHVYRQTAYGWDEALEILQTSLHFLRR